MKYLFIIRGLPGSGKTTVAEVLANEANVHSADDFFMRGGEYMWNPKQLGAAHDWCKKKVKNDMCEGKEKIFVANTNTTKKEMKPYIEMAEQYGYMVFSLIVENRHDGVNVHNVPSEALERMSNLFDIKL